MIDDGYFQEYFGYSCVDGGTDGKIGKYPEVFFMERIQKKDLYPIHEKIESYSEDDLFDVIELLYDCCSAPTKGYYHQYSNCGYHYEEFDADVGRKYFRETINNSLKYYETGYEISSDGEILAFLEDGFSNLETTPLASSDAENITQRVESAIKKYKKYKSTLDDRRDAVRNLADVLELIRPEIKNHFNSKDESDLFQIINKFGIRHHDSRQQTNYDTNIWHSWMFYFFLSTIHAALKIIEKNKQNITK